MEITVRGFANGGRIPQKFTCDGDNVSPEIMIEGVPSEAKSLVLIMDDPDAPSGLFTHWIAYDILPDTKLIEQGAGNGSTFKSCINDFGKHGYGGPCPPPGKPHMYNFTLYALDTERLDAGNGRKGIDSAMQGRIIEKASYSGIYSR